MIHIPYSWPSERVQSSNFYTRCCAALTQSQLQNIFISPQENLEPLAVTPHLLPGPQVLAATNLLAVSMDLSPLDISFEWNSVMVEFGD